MQRLPKECTHLVLSVGGNNALTEASRLGISFFGLTGDPSSKSLDSLADISNEFESQYRSAVDVCVRSGLPLGVCTIYNSCFPDKSYQRIASLALAIFNDVIIRVAIERGLSVIDLRLICTTLRDYANSIEPSSIGGEKIARVIVALVTGRDDQMHGTRILGVANEIPKADTTKSNSNSPDGLLFDVTIDGDRLKGTAMEVAMSHAGTHIADIRSTASGIPNLPFYGLEFRAW
jgi:hypothetical protein